jgi:2-polyprenyl-6-methoxyphenol hydroxylase-like FAD-dependent oxidoreductase
MLVAGGGIAGPSTTIALRRAGFGPDLIALTERGRYTFQER